MILAVILGLSACSGVGEDTELSEVAEQRGLIDDAKQTARAQTVGVLSPGESDCIIGALFSEPGVTAGQVVEFARKPDPSSPLMAVYSRVVPSCIDRSATVQPAPLTPELRASMIAAIRAADPSITDKRSACLLDGVLAAGVTPRELTLSGTTSNWPVSGWIR